MIQNNRRIPLLDIIRGIALFGILLVNMQSFHSPHFKKIYYDITISYHGLEEWLSFFFQLFIQMKFYPIFSFLFGLGFYLFISKTNGITLFVKRMAFLLIFGLLHLIFLWYGDILHLYAITGLFLIAFHKLPDRQLIYWAFSLLAFYHVLLGASIFISVEDSTVSHQQRQNVSNYFSVYSDAPYLDMVLYRIKVEVLPILFQLPIAMIPILGMFLLGLYAGRKKLYTHNNTNHMFIRKLWKISFVISMPLVLINGLFITSYFDGGSNGKNLVVFLTSLSGITLSIFYMSSLFLLTEHKKIASLLHPFSYIGRMALTNYLFQTIISICLVRFFNMYGKIGLFSGTIISLLLFYAQFIISYLWLTKFLNGPMEWLWRSLTYGEYLPFKKEKK